MTADTALARLDDDGSPIWTADPGLPQPRLYWAPTAGRFAGVWWPLTGDATEELVQLLPLVSARMGGRVTRVSLNIDAWSAAQPRRLELPTGKVRLGWFRTLDTNTITVGRGTDRITLLVIPPTASPSHGNDLLGALAAMPSWPDSSNDALGADGDSQPQEGPNR